MEELDAEVLTVLSGDGCPGSLVCHHEDEDSRGIIVSERSSGVGIMWSVAPNISEMTKLKARFRKIVKNCVGDPNDKHVLMRLQGRIYAELETLKQQAAIINYDTSVIGKQLQIKVQPIMSLHFVTMNIAVG